MDILVIFLVVIGIIIAILWIGGVVYIISKGRVFKRFYHHILQWHLPNNEPQEFDGCNICAKCKICGKSIMQDSQGNWF
jgi:hypothetical protein